MISNLRRLLRSSGTRGYIAVAMAAAIMAGPVSGEDVDSMDYINFSFDELDVRAFVKLVGDMTGRRFLVDSEVQGRVSVVAPHVHKNDVPALFERVLKSSGCVAVQDDGMWRIVPVAKGM